MMGRRKAQDFEDAWSSKAASSSGPSSAEVRDLIRTAELVCAAAVVEPSPAFSAALRQRLMEQAPAVMVAGDPQPQFEQTPARSRRGLRVLVAFVVTAILGAGTVGASASAVPGDLLYGVKLTTEKVERAVAQSDDRLGRVMLAQATERLEEATELAAGSHDPERMETLLTQYRRAADEGTTLLMGDPRRQVPRQNLQVISEFAEDSARRLAELAELLPPAEQGLLGAAVEVLRGLTSDLTTACPACVPTGNRDLSDEVSGLADAVETEAGKAPVTPSITVPSLEPSPTPALAPTRKPVIAPLPTEPPTSLGDGLAPVTGGLLGNDDQVGLVPGLLDGLGLGGLLGLG